MEVKTVAGMMVDIADCEARRIAEHYNAHHMHHMHEKTARQMKMEEDNDIFIKKAQKHIQSLCGICEKPKCEDDLKEILYAHMSCMSCEQADLLYEVMEMMVGLHSKKIFQD